MRVRAVMRENEDEQVERGMEGWENNVVADGFENWSLYKSGVV